jgi:enediyne biosynthesis protein E4
VTPRLIRYAIAFSILSHTTFGAEQHPRFAFTEVAAQSGIDFAMTSGTTPSEHILDVDGGGVAIIDFDNDGDLDLFFANGATRADPEHGPGSRLYANRGDGTFDDVTKRYGINVTRWAMGVAVGDYDGDGFDDLYITCFGSNILLRNQTAKPGIERFVDTTKQAAVGDNRWSTSAAFGDIDGDGDLDLYVVNYLEFDIANPPSREGKRYKGVPVMAGPHGLRPQADVLYENLGHGRFKDITQTSGCVPDHAGYGLVALMIDVDRDGRQDIFVGNDSTENFLFHNTGQGKFEEIGTISGLASNMDGANQATMGIAIGDLDGNGLPDIFTTSFSSDSNTLHLNFDGAFFEDRTSQFGLGLVSRPFLCWSCGIYDFDCDGTEDIFASAGHVYPEAETHKIDSDYSQPPLLFARDKTRRFRRITGAGEVVTHPLRGRATAFGDLDNDGDVDIVLTQLNDKVKIFRNDAVATRLIAVDLQQPSPNHRAYGSMVELVAGKHKQTRWIHGGGSFQSVDAPIAYFAIPERISQKPTLHITWPSGKKTTVTDVPYNRRVTVSPDAKTLRIAKLRKRKPAPPSDR